MRAGDLVHLRDGYVLWSRLDTKYLPEDFAVFLVLESEVHVCTVLCPDGTKVGSWTYWFNSV